MPDEVKYVIRYGYDYETEDILGVYSSIYYARKAKKEFEALPRVIRFPYHFVIIEAFEINRSYDEEDR